MGLGILRFEDNQGNLYFSQCTCMCTRRRANGVPHRSSKHQPLDAAPSSDVGDGAAKVPRLKAQAIIRKCRLPPRSIHEFRLMSQICCSTIQNNVAGASARLLTISGSRYREQGILSGTGNGAERCFAARPLRLTTIPILKNLVCISWAI